MPYSTPQDSAGNTITVTVVLPSDPAWLAIFYNMLLKLTKDYMWEQSENGVTVTEAVTLATEIILGTQTET